MARPTPLSTRDLSTIARPRAAFAGLLLLLSSTIARSADQVLFSSNAGECRLSAEWSEEWQTLRLRPYHPSGKNCFIEKNTLESVLTLALSKLDLAETGRKVDSLYIGRLIEYPWLSQALAVTARHDRRWDGKRGKPRHIDINAYVAEILSGRDNTAAFDEAMTKGGYKVRSASVEKVLVGRFRDVPLYRDNTASGLVPYDAQVWFHLERR